MFKKAMTVLAISVSSSLFLTACNDNDTTEQAQNMQYDNIVTAAQAKPELSVLVEAVVASGLQDTLSSKNGPAPFTVFAPTNDAFVALLKELGVTKAQLLADKNLLTKVLTYHVVAGNKVAKSDIKLNQPMQTINGNAFKVNDKLQLIDAAGNAANIVATDVMTGNGVVHVIDKVVLPESKNLVQIAQSKPDFSILVEAVVAAGLVDTITSAKDLTIFAPTNAAFASLLTELNLTKEQLFADKALLTSVLTYHVVADRIYSSEVMTGKVNTLQTGQFSIDTGNGVVITDGKGRKANVVATDVQASNGVIHVIDKVILPEAK